MVQQGKKNSCVLRAGGGGDFWIFSWYIYFKEKKIPENVLGEYFFKKMMVKN